MRKQVRGESVKLKRRLAIGLLLLCLLGGCAAGRTGGPQAKAGGEATSTEHPATTDKAEESGRESRLLASYTVPDGWILSEKYSSDSKIFYVQEGHEEDRQPDNISVEVGTNRYGLEEHDKFRYAILRQLTMQVQGSSAKVTGEGVNTEQDYIMYIFTIDDDSVLTKQYYIVDDHRYCLIHLTDFSKNEDAKEAARAIADSFVWDEGAGDAD